MSAIYTRMPKLPSFRVGAPGSMARKSQILDAFIEQFDELISQAKDDKAYCYESPRNAYLDGVIDQLTDLKDFINKEIQ